MLESRASLAERRRHPRTEVHMTLRGIRLDPEGGDVVDDLHMVDISRGGMGAISDRPYYPGQRLVLCVPLSNDGGQRTIYATVVRCRQGDDGYHLGMTFDSICVGAWSEVGGAIAAAA